MKKLIMTYIFALSIVFTQFCTASAAENTSVDTSRYFYQQLGTNAQKIYNAMEQMNEQHIFWTGSGDYDLTVNGYVTQAQVKSYADGDSTLLKDMGAARDAYCADHPEIFYVDFSYLSLRATKDAAGTYHAYLGTGRSESYYTEGFTSEEQVESAISAYNSALEKIVEEAKALTADDNTKLLEKQVKYVHDTIINSTSYRMEGVCDNGNEGFIRTAYGSLVKGQAVCEGYARAMKAVLDRLGIPCILVQGVVRQTEDTPQAHMWNYVQIDGSWYGVDATWDDPVSPDGGTSTQGTDGYENSSYLLLNETSMNVSHVASGIWSSVGYEFTYPDLSLSELGYNTVSSDNGLTVQYKEIDDDELPSGEYKVSYKSMGYAAAAAKGKYIVGKFYQYDKQKGTYIDGGWGYLDPDIYDFTDTATALTLTLPHVSYVEFAVTTIAPEEYDGSKTEEAIERSTTYTGDPLLFEAATSVLYNKNGTYVAPPYAESVTPAVSGRLTVGKTYPVTIVYDETLEQTGTLDYTVTSTGTTAVEYCRIENLSWDGKRTVSFNFTPSEYFADNSVSYTIQVTGLQGKYSQKLPNSINYIASTGCVAFAYKSVGYDWNVFGQPALIGNVDLSTSGWTTNDGTKVSDVLTNQLALVTTRTSGGRRLSD